MGEVRGRGLRIVKPSLHPLIYPLLAHRDPSSPAEEAGEDVKPGYGELIVLVPARP